MLSGGGTDLISCGGGDERIRWQVKLSLCCFYLSRNIYEFNNSTIILCRMGIDRYLDPVADINMPERKHTVTLTASGRVDETLSNSIV